MHSPHIVAITELRRSGASIVDHAVASGAPVFVTQRGHVKAVLVSRDLYDRLVRSFRPPGHGASEPQMADPSERASLIPESHPPGALVQTRFGLTDAETAAFLAEEGFGRR